MTATKASDIRHATVFEVNGWAVSHTTTLWRSYYSIAVRVPSGEIVNLDGPYDEPLSHLLARFDPAILADLQEAVAKDTPRDGDLRDLDWEVRSRDVRRIAETAASDAVESPRLYTPVPFDDGKAALAD